jgi:hypothetical protein
MIDRRGILSGLPIAGEQESGDQRERSTDSLDSRPRL